MLGGDLEGGLVPDDVLEGPGLGEAIEELSVADLVGPDGIYNLPDGDGEIPLRLLGPVDAAVTGTGADAARSGLSKLAATAATAYAPAAGGAMGSTGPPTPSNWLVSDSGQLFLLVGGVNAVFEPHLGEVGISALLARHGVAAEHVSPLGELPNAYLIATASDAGALRLAAALSADSGVVSAVPNLFTPPEVGLVSSQQSYPSMTSQTNQRCSPYEKLWPDRFAGCLWHLNADTDYRYYRTDPTMDINLGDVWDTTMGAGVTVAVVDGTWEATHEDIAANADTARSKLWGGLTGEPKSGDYPYHGTGVAGIVGARDNSVGGRGVAPRATLLNYNLLDSYSWANEVTALTRNKATVAAYNMSYMARISPSLSGSYDLWRRAVNEGLSSGFGGKGSSYVKIAGNGADTAGSGWATLDATTNHRGVITVCAVGADGRRANYSEKGPSLLVCAPSGATGQAGILAPIGKNGYMHYFSGTSAAAPMVSGVVALMRSANADLTWRDVKVILANTAQKNDASSTGWMSGATKYGSSTESYSFSYEYGFGTVDAKAAVTASSGWTLLPAEMSAEATSATVISLPASGSEIELSLDVQSAMDFAEHVSVAVNAETYDFRDYRWTLVSPSGAESLLAPEHTSCDQGKCGLRGTFRFGSSRHLGEDPSGTWKLKVRRYAPAETGCSSTLTINTSQCRKIASYNESIKSWKIVVTGHKSASGQAVSLSVSPLSVAEGGEADVTVKVTGTAPTQNLVVPLKITDGTTTAAGSPGADYTALASITVPAGASSASAKLATTQDSVDEADETFTVGLGSLPTGYRPVSSTATVTIKDDDPLPVVTLSADRTTVTEGDSATITASLSGASSQDVTLDVSAAAVAPAKSGDGSLGSSTTLTIAAGSTASTGSVVFTASQNDVDEADDAPAKTFTISAAASGGNGVADPSAVTLTIQDDDDAPAGYTVDAGVVSRVKALAAQVQHGSAHVNRWQRVLVAFGEHDGTGVSGGAMTAAQAQQMADAHSSPVWDEVVAELTKLEAAASPLPVVSITGDSGVTEGGAASFTITASPAPASPITVKVGVSESGSFGASGAATVTVSGASTTYTVTTTDDSADEVDGSVTATLKDGSGYTVSSTGGSATVAVADDDDPPPALPVVSISSDGDVTEGSAATFTVSATTVGKWPGVLGLVLPVSVTVSVTGDYGVTAGSRSLSISRLTGSVKLSVATASDDVDEADGTVTVTVDASSAYAVSTTAGSASAAVADDDDAPAGYTVDAGVVARVEALAAQVQHGGAHVNRWQRVLVAFGEHDGTGVTGGAMTAAQAQQMADRHSSPVWDEVVAELTKLEAAASPLPELSIAAGSGVTEGGTASFTITASPAPASPITVKVAVSESGSFGASGAATVTVSGATATYTVSTADDSADEADGSVTATLEGGSGYTVSPTQGSATVAVADNDDPPPVVPVVSISGGSGVTEGATASFTVTASPAPASPISVKVAVSESGSFGASGAATVTVSGASATYTVSTSDDSTDEADGSVTATLQGGSGYTVSPTKGSASVSVADNDDPPVITPVVSISGGSGVTEGGTASFTITASPAPASPITVKVAVSESGSFGASGAAAVTVSGATTTYTVSTSDDSADEADGSVTATLKGGSGYTVSPTKGSASVSVADNDDPPPVPAGVSVSLSASASSISEAGGEAKITITLDRALVTGQWVRVPFTLAGGDQGDHWTLDMRDDDNPAGGAWRIGYGAESELLFYGGGRTATLVLTAKPDADAADRAITITLAAGPRAITSGGIDGGVETGTKTVTVTITDND